MAERCIKGDYIGFTFGDVHSSELGLMRVSNGSRYEQDLLPPLQDKKVQVVGRDGEIYFGSQYNTKPIKVPVAFDNMNEESFQKLKRLLADKKPKYLWFDETPYKQWLVKSANVQNFKWVCFDDSKDPDDPEPRRYKGEGTLEFNCFTPYAESRVLFLDEPVDYVWDWNRTESPKRLVQYFKDNENYLERKRKELGKELSVLTLECNYNFNEWKDASGLRYKTIIPDDLIWEGQYNVWGSDGFPEVVVYNPGNQEANYKLIWWDDEHKHQFPGDEIFFLITYEEIASQYTDKTMLKIEEFKLKEEDYGIMIDSKLKIIKGIDQTGKPTGNIYSKYYVAGDFYKIPPSNNIDSKYKYSVIYAATEEAKYEIELIYHYI